MAKITRAQMKELAHLISVSMDVGEEAKKVILWLLYKTDRLTKSVGLSLFSEQCGELAKNVCFGVHDMLSSKGTTHLADLLGLVGSDFRFCGHCGCFNDRHGEFNTKIEGYTIWISPTQYDLGVERIEYAPESIKNIKLVNRDTPISEF